MPKPAVRLAERPSSKRSCRNQSRATKPSTMGCSTKSTACSHCSPGRQCAACTNSSLVTSRQEAAASTKYASRLASTGAENSASA